MLVSQASRSLKILMPTKKERGFNRYRVFNRYSPVTSIKTPRNLGLGVKCNAEKRKRTLSDVTTPVQEDYLTFIPDSHFILVTVTLSVCEDIAWKIKFSENFIQTKR